MKTNTKRQLLISGKHKRLQRLWQSLFTGWGLVMVAALTAGALLNKNMLWTPIAAINMKDIAQNQFRMENPSFAGLDKNGNPFSIKASTARQEYEFQDKVFMSNVRAKVVHINAGKKITDNITAKSGVYDKVNKTMTLTGNVRIDSSNGDKVLTNEMTIRF